MVRSATVKCLMSQVLVGCLLLVGCSSNKQAQELALASVVEQATANNIEDVIQNAEEQYEQGCEYYKQHQWPHAQQAFDAALEILLEADVDAETHYKLSEAYNRLFYKIRMLESAQAALASAAEEALEQPESTEQLEAFLSATQGPEALDAVQNLPEAPVGDTHTPTIFGEIVIDEHDSLILKYVKELSRERSEYRDGLRRAAQYLPMMKKIFAAHHVPTELVYLPLIESNFRINAVSPAGAVGLWQFVRSTARGYGLKVDKGVDERRDPEKSTRAAANYLKDLYEMLGDWDLALAGYYMGEYKVHEAIGRHRTRDVSQLAQTRAFGQGAKHYISRMKAVILLAQNPEKYHLPASAEFTVAFDTIDVKRGVRFKDLAQELGLSYQDLCRLNPELTKEKTPSGSGLYPLKVPQGFASTRVAQTPDLEYSARPAAVDDVKVEQPKVEPKTAPKQEMLTHKVRRGENLTAIAKKYGANLETIKKLNGIRNTKSLRVGQKLRIPTSGTSLTALQQEGELGTHTIRKGETLGEIAKRYNMSLVTLKSLNHIKNEKNLRVGQTLKVRLSQPYVFAQAKTDARKMFTYQIKRGDSLSKIASTFGVSVSELRKWNKLEVGTVLYPGSRIKVGY